MQTIDTAGEGKRRLGLTVAAWLLLGAGLVVAFYYNFSEMWLRWFPGWRRSALSLYDRIVGGESYYTHGPLVPILSLFISLLLIRYTRIPVRRRPAIGGAVLSAGLFLHLVGSLARVNFVSGFAFIVVVAGLVLLFWGEMALRRLWFPVAMLLFMVPLPEVTIAQWNFRLKMFAAEWGVSLANMLGVVVAQSGNRVFLEGEKNLVIANVCNGLRTLISVIAFGALYAYVCRLRGFWRLLLFAMSVPVAVVANSLRIVSLIVVADVWDVATATGWYHDTSGLFIFVLAFLLMFGTEKLILWGRAAAGRPAKVVPLFDGVQRGAEDRDQWGRMFGAVGGAVGWAAGAAILLVGAASLWLNQPAPTRWNQQMAGEALPRELTVDGRQWRSYDLPLDALTLMVLETPDYLYRRYVRPGAAAVDFCVIFSKDNRKGTHPPDLCLEGSGEGIVAKGEVSVSVAGRGDLPCREIIIQEGMERTYFLYVYKCAETYTGSFWRQQYTIFVNGLLRRDASGALIRISTSAVEGDEAARRRAVEFLREAVPYLDRSLR